MMNRFLSSMERLAWEKLDGAEICKTLVLSLGHTVWQGALLALLLALILRSGLLARSRQYQLAFSGLLLLGALPVINFFWFLPSLYMAQASLLPLPFHDLPYYSSHQSWSFGIGGDAEISPDNASLANGESLAVGDSHSLSDEALAVGDLPAVNAQQLIAPTHSKGRSTWFPWGSVYLLLAMAYWVGVLVMGGRIVRSVMAQRKACHLADQVGHILPSSGDNIGALSNLRQAANQAAQRLGYRGRLRLSLIGGPMAAVVVGCFRPLILVNLTLATGLTPRQLEQVLAHELVHLMRLDPLALLIQRLIEATQFFNPPMWWISRQVSELREHCCDQVVGKHYGSVEYAETLVECAAWEHQLHHPLALAVTGGQVSGIRQRIGVLLELPVEHNSWLSSAGRYSRWLSRSGWIGKLAVGCVGMGLLATCWCWPLLLEQDENEPKLASPQWLWKQSHEEEFDRTRMAFQSRRLLLSDQPPEGTQVDAMVDLSQCQFAQWQFGDTHSRRVTLMVEFDGGYPLQVYLDLNRDRRIEDSERLMPSPNDARLWLASLSVEIQQEGQVVIIDRPLAIDFTSDSKFVRIATLGFAEGSIEVGERKFLCRRFDNDGDGIPLGFKDDLWIDLDGDQKFDPITERFAYTPWLEIDGRKFALQSDALGQDMRLTAAAELGSVNFLAKLADAQAQVIDLQGTLRDRYGHFVPVRMDSLKAEVLPGEYCIESLVVTVLDGKGESWFITMSRGFEADWFEVHSNQTTEIDLLATPRLHAVSELVSGPYGRVEAGFTPYLIGPSGLIVTDFKRAETETVMLELKLSRPDGRSIDGLWTNTCSGFG